MNTEFLTCTFKSIPSISPVALTGEGSIIVGTGSIAITCVCSSSAFINIYTAKETKMEGRKEMLYLTIHSAYCIYSYMIYGQVQVRKPQMYGFSAPLIDDRSKLDLYL